MHFHYVIQLFFTHFGYDLCDSLTLPFRQIICPASENNYVSTTDNTSLSILLIKTTEIQ